MGREVTGVCQWGGEKGAVKALLESDELILRGDIKRHVRLSAMTDVRVNEGEIHFTVGADRVTLTMAASEAVRWLKKLNTPGPSLREKLGLSANSKAVVLNKVTDPALETALLGMTTSDSADARMVIAVANDDNQLAAAVQAHQPLPSGSPIWIIHGKGREAVFGEARVREGMRSRGFIDTKVAAVSQGLTASRYSKRK